MFARTPGRPGIAEAGGAGCVWLFRFPSLTRLQINVATFPRPALPRCGEAGMWEVCPLVCRAGTALAALGSSLLPALVGVRACFHAVWSVSSPSLCRWDHIPLGAARGDVGLSFL